MKIKKFLPLCITFAGLTLNSFAAPKYISPKTGSEKGELVIPLKISEKRFVQAWSLVIMDQDHKPVRIIENKVALPEKIGFKSFFKQVVTPKQGVIVPESVSWNGAMNNGETAPDGLYYYYFTATDDNGNEGRTKEYQVIIDTIAPDVELSQPTDKIFGEGEKSNFKIRQTGSQEDEWTGIFKNADGKTVRTYKWVNSEPVNFSWNGTDDQGAQVPDGIYTYEISSTDRAGNHSNDAVISNIIYSAQKPATNIFLSSSKYFSPETESALSQVKFDITIPVPEANSGNKLVEWAVQIENKAGKVVRTYNNEKNGESPLSEIVFDGLDDNSTLLKDGEYKASITAKYLNGYVPAKISSPVVVLDREKPLAQIKASDKVFGGGTKSSVKFSILIAPQSGAPVENWKGEIQTVDTAKTVKTYDFGQFPPDSIVWNGLDDAGNLVEEAQYILVLSAKDLAGNIGGGRCTDLVSFNRKEATLLLAASDAAFSPTGNSNRHTISFNPVANTKDIIQYVFEIKNSSNETVYKLNGEKNLPKNFVWDGRRSEAGDKTQCENGIYKAELSITAANGSVAKASSDNFEIDNIAPSLKAQIPWLAFSCDGDGNQDTLPVSILECSSEKLWTAEINSSDGKLVKKYTWSGSSTGFDWDGTDESGNIAKDGMYSIKISSTDEAGNNFSTDFKNINLDNRETKVYLTSEYEGISPNGDGNFDAQLFQLKTSVAEGISSWNFDVRKEDGTAVYSLSDKDSKNLPAKITWNGLKEDSTSYEGTYIASINLVYAKGNRVSAVSSPFVCTAIPPVLKVQTYPEYFSPDNDGIDDDLYIRLTGNTKAKIKNWSFVIKDPKGKDFWKLSGKNQITERLTWDGLSNVQKDTNGNAERVQSAMDYPYEFTATDSLGMTRVITGVIPVDVLVIRDGNVLKMAVPSIIFESDEANFQNVTARLSKEQVERNLQILNRISDILKKFKDYKVEIVGHANRLTDNPEEETVDNLREWGKASTPLSKARADAIKAYLVKHGVSAQNLTTEGKGGTRPVVNPKDKDNNWKNRRVEFILEK